MKRVEQIIDDRSRVNGFVRRPSEKAITSFCANEMQILVWVFDERASEWTVSIEIQSIELHK